MRSDGKRIKAVNPMYEIVPYIMPKRYDAQNLVNIQLDEDRIRDYLREKRATGIQMDHMTVLIAAYLRTCANYPVLNRFVVNKKIYQRNHFCVCYVMLKKMPDGTMDETINKIYLDLNDDIFTVHKKIQEVVRKNAEAEYDNSMDKFIHGLLRIPVLPSFIVSVLKVMDRYGLMPRKVIDLSPFHTSLFVTNLASINSNYIYHHLYDFGTTSIFIALGKIIRDYRNNRDDRRIMPLGITMDERIATGHDFARMFVSLKKYLRDPSLLERTYEEEQQMAPEHVKEVAAV